jgi:hypothetical protein
MPLSCAAARDALQRHPHFRRFLLPEAEGEPGPRLIIYLPPRFHLLVRFAPLPSATSFAAVTDAPAVAAPSVSVAKLRTDHWHILPYLDPLLESLLQ